MSTRILAIALLGLLSTPAEAQPGRFSRGDAEAVLHASSTGGAVLRSHGDTHGAPLPPGASIRPYFDAGIHYCVLDWHVISAGWVDFVFEKPTDPGCLACLHDYYGDPLNFTSADSIASFDPVSNAFELDGEPFDTIQTPVKPFLNQAAIDANVADIDDVCGCEVTVTGAYGVLSGQVIGPSDLGVGEHTLSDHFTFAAGEFDFATSFFIDPPGSPACTQ